MSVKFLDGGDGKMHHYSRVKSTQLSFFDEICEGEKRRATLHRNRPDV